MLQKVRVLRFIVPATVLLIVIGLFGAQSVFAGGVVGNGTPGSCTETAFDSLYASGGQITFNCGPNPKTINFFAVKPLSTSLTIDGGNKITLKENNANHFQVSFGTTLTLKNITLSNGNWSQGGSIENHGTLKLNHATFKGNHSSTDGGAIWSQGTVNVKNSTFANNSSENSGGAIFFDSGAVTVNKSTFSKNKAKNGNFGGAIENKGGTLNISGSLFSANGAYNGGAIDNSANASTTYIDTSTFDKNTAGNWGGALMNLGGFMQILTSTLSNGQAVVGGGLASTGTTLKLERTTISGNTTTGDGGGLYLSGINGTQTLTNVTISGNKSTGGGNGGGGIFQHYGNVTLNFVTIANNSASYGGGIHKDYTDPTPSYMNLINTVLSANSPSNCSGVPASLGHNLSSDTYCGGVFTGPGDKNHKNAKLGTLKNNGGPTLTISPLAGSPLINKGVTYGGVSNDQRGLSRPFNGGYDIGAVEVH